MNEMILWLTDSRCLDARLVGNKCAALTHALQAGHQVPRGFAVTTSGLQTATCRSEIERALAGLVGPWVVRSSSSVEDSTEAAFAGLFQTVLGLGEVADVFDAIETVAQSAHDDAVLAYAARRGIDANTIHMAVLVQELVPSAVAGVAFSRNPVTGANETVIESNYGLGDTVVNGSVVTDWFRLAHSGVILERRLGAKHEKLVVAPDSGLRREATSLDERRSLTLSDDRVREIGALTRELERETRCPVDVEWAIVGSQVELLQVRPVTTGITP